MAWSSTTYPKKWNSGKTKVIRVPERHAESLLEIARKVDAVGDFRIREENGVLILEMVPTRSIQYSAQKPVNVASVPQRSPFRYPGGKTWLVPYIRDWLRSKNRIPSRLIEPFAGGGIVSLTAGFENLAKHILMAELDPGVAAVWKVVLNGQSEWLARKILNFDLTEETARSELNRKRRDTKHIAFQTILRNRVQRGGIMAPGAGLIKSGEGGRGITSRWYPTTLARRIREINQQKDKFTFLETDAFKVIQDHRNDRDTCFYIDPPYLVASKRLYSSWQVDHEKLFKDLSRCRGDVLMSYDNTVEIAELAKTTGFQTRPIAMKSSHHAKMTELLIGKDLSWMDAQ